MTAVIIVAAGSGSRLGADVPKAFVRVGGRTLVDRAVASARPLGGPIVVAVPAGHEESTAEALGDDVIVVAGGATRQSSVAAALAAVPEEARIVLVHDAARALTPPAQFARVRDAVAASGCGVIPVLPVTDTMKGVHADGTVLGTVARDTLRAVQTPQGFPRAALDAAYAADGADHTDDAALFQADGGRVVTVQGDADAFKITTPWDLERAEDLAGRGGVRTGVGADVHATDASAELWLGGLRWEGEPGLAGHSDGDAVLHALCDAVLSAAGLGDIGAVFGTDAPRFAGARSDVFVREAVSLAAERGLEVAHASVEVIAQRPRIGPRRAELEARLAELVGAPVAVAATTSDRLGITGSGEGIAAVATALLRRASGSASHK